MAMEHVQEYLAKMQAQYLTMKADLADFEQALRDGYITEDKLQAAIEDVNLVEANYRRLQYIDYLFGIPSKHRKLRQHEREHKKLLNTLKSAHATENDIIQENNEALAALKENLNKLKNDTE